MRNLITKMMMSLFALAVIASIATAACSTAFAYDESEIVVPFWEEDTKVESDNRD